MPDLADGETFQMRGSAATPYVLRNTGGVYSCSCPAWRNQSIAIEQRTCKHLRKLRGDAAEQARVGSALPQKPAIPGSAAGADGEDGEAAGPPLLLAHSWDSVTDLSGWWMSEKLDGVRAYWDGKHFLSRLGNLYHAPDWFVEGLPDIPLDGELWIDRKKFQRTVSIVRRQDKCDLWREVKFVVFDAPAAGGTFEERTACLKEALARRGAGESFVRPHEHDLCRDTEHLRAELARIEALGGEGLMLRQPGSVYEAGRSSTLLKVKSFHDANAVVIGHLPGAGRHKGRLGALLVRFGDGVELSVGTGLTDRERSTPPPVGATITFRFQELSDTGVPRFPSFVGVRAESAVMVAAAPGPGPSSRVGLVVDISPKEREPAPSALPAARPSEGTPRRFELIDGATSKFWEVCQVGADLNTRWGRLGTAGQSKSKAFPDEAAAAEEMAKLMEDKTHKGYVETTA